MRIPFFILIFLLSVTTLCIAQENTLLIDDFENPVSGGPQGTVDFGAGGGSWIDVTSDTSIKHSGKQSLKVTYEAIAGGYMWIARGFDLDAKNTAWLVRPEDIEWQKFSAISFYMYGNDSKTRIAFDIRDNGSEMWRFILEDDFTGWRRITCPFNEFFCRSDWQPNKADKNGILDFPLRSFQFEPLPEAKGVLYFDTVELVE